MNGIGTVDAIHLAPDAGAETEAVESAEAVAGEGVRGDRHFASDGADLTLVEAEALDAAAEGDGNGADGPSVDLTDGEHRRNVTTRDVALNHLVGERFRVGEAVCEGVELCEPCGHLESLTEDGAVSALVHRGGLEADVVESGAITVGDGVEPL